MNQRLVGTGSISPWLKTSHLQCQWQTTQVISGHPSAMFVPKTPCSLQHSLIKMLLPWKNTTFPLSAIQNKFIDLFLSAQTYA